jgi:hypothetical protein
MFAANATKLYDVTTNTPTLIKTGQASGNYCASQLANQRRLSDRGQRCRRLSAALRRHHWGPCSTPDQITGPVGSTVVAAATWCTSASIAIAGSSSKQLDECLVPAAQCRLRRAGTDPAVGRRDQGRQAAVGASWSIDAGDGIDDKCVFITDQGELLIFTGSDPSDRRQLAPGGPLSGLAADGHERAHGARRRPPDRDR